MYTIFLQKLFSSIFNSWLFDCPKTSTNVEDSMPIVTENHLRKKAETFCFREYIGLSQLLFTALLLLFKMQNSGLKLTIMRQWLSLETKCAKIVNNLVSTFVLLHGVKSAGQFWSFRQSWIKRDITYLKMRYIESYMFFVLWDDLFAKHRRVGK